MSEKNYDFRKFLDEVYQKDLRYFSLKPRADESEITGEWVIRIPENVSGFVRETARYLSDFLFNQTRDVGVRIEQGKIETAGKSKSYETDSLKKEIHV